MQSPHVQQEILSLAQRLSNRLQTQQGGKGKIARQFLKRQARLGRATLPSGYGVSVNVTASI